ncbi:MAG TPA: transketolase family protein [candidate division CPR3 bacterium]|uniref:Transketolase family protein n=1 Tax=candidate division CPR3 bacterium TaxID=2268181 RepID=A0A7C1SXE7_UNCC3|nr:transketolase family protein [candidate division CPR3 bacterium]
MRKEAYLHSKVLSKPEMVPTRNGYGEGLLEAGKKDKDIVVLCADLSESTRSNYFQEKFPERFVEVGVAEQNMASLASGMALAGKTVFISSYAVFSPGRNNEQIRTTIAINDVNVKIVGAHAGVSVGPDGATHQALEDIALMRVMPNMKVLYPCDAEEARKTTVAASSIKGPVYIRLARAETPVITTKKTPFRIGRAEVFAEGKDVTIIASGPLVYEALKAANGMSNSIEVINLHTIKPLDEKTILRSVKKTGCVVTIEEHQKAGGMGSAVVEMLSQNYPVAVEMIGVSDRFGESGNPEELLQAFKLTAKDITKAVQRVIKRK